MDGWNRRPLGWEEYDVSETYVSETDVSETDVSETETSSPSLPYLLQKQIQLSIKRPDIIIVLAGGLDDKGEPHPWVKRRLDLSVQIYKQFYNKTQTQTQTQKSKDFSPIQMICTGGGTYHKPSFLNKNGFAVHESTACAEYLIKSGIDPSIIYKEWSSYDTIANAYFTFLMHILPQVQQTSLLQQITKNIVIITSDFHMDRCEAIFKWVFSLFPNCSKYLTLNFIRASDSGLDKNIIEARCKREKKSLDNLKKVIEQVNTKEKLYEWIYQEHQAYSCRFDRGSIKSEVDNEVQKSY